MLAHDLSILAALVAMMLTPWALFELAYWWKGRQPAPGAGLMLR